MRTPTFAVLALLTFASQAEAQTSLQAVLKDFEQKTIVMGQDDKGGIVKVGEKISGYCRGFLEGALAVLVRSQTICVKNEAAFPDFLLSAVLTYRTEVKSQDNDAANVIEAAFKRAFNCKK